MKRKNLLMVIFLLLLVLLISCVPREKALAGKAIIGDACSVNTDCNGLYCVNNKCVMTETGCGNGLIDSGEICDAGGIQGIAGCSKDCLAKDSDGPSVVISGTCTDVSGTHNDFCQGTVVQEYQLTTQIDSSTGNLNYISPCVIITPLHDCSTRKDGLTACYDGACVDPSSVPAPAPGDMNNDGLLDISDVIAFVKALVENSLNVNTGDVNGDGNVNILDAVELMRIVRG